MKFRGGVGPDVIFIVTLLAFSWLSVLEKTRYFASGPSPRAMLCVDARGFMIPWLTIFAESAGFTVHDCGGPDGGQLPLYIAGTVMVHPVTGTGLVNTCVPEPAWPCERYT